MSIADRESECPPSGEDAWAMLQTLHERVIRSLARGEEYDLLLNASRDAEGLLARHAADCPTVREQHAHIENASSRKVA